jgi:hypothetical protein
MNIEMIKKIILVILVLILGVGGFFWFKNRQIKGSYKDYVVKEVGGRKVMENKKAGFSVSVPVGWEAKVVNFDEGAATFYSPDLKADWKDGRMVVPIQKGCVIQTYVVYKEMSFDQIEQEAKYTHSIMGRISEEFENIKLGQHQALKNSFDTKKSGPGIGIYIPQKEKVYSFYLSWFSSDKLTCVQEYNKFLETISIK